MTYQVAVQAEEEIDDIQGNYQQAYDDSNDMDDVGEDSGQIQAKVALTYQALRACVITGDNLTSDLDSTIITPLVNRYGDSLNLATNWTDLDNPNGAWQLAVVPLKEKGFNEVTGKVAIVAVGAGVYKIPTLDGVLNLGDNGRLYLNELLRKDALDKVNKARKDGKALPISLTQFTTFGLQESNELATWNKLAKSALAYLKTRHLDISKEELESVLRSASYAEARYEGIENEKWDMLIKALISKCDKFTTINKLTKKEELTPLNPQVFITWLDNRYTTVIEEKPVDFNGLDFSNLL